MIKVMVVFGTRPEAIKMCPVVNELKNRKNIRVVTCVSGQHKQLLNSVIDIFSVKADYNLKIMKDKQTLFDITQRVLERIKKVLIEVAPDIVLVHGDTSTAFAVSLSCFVLRFLIKKYSSVFENQNKVQRMPGPPITPFHFENIFCPERLPHIPHLYFILTKIFLCIKWLFFCGGSYTRWSWPLPSSGLLPPPKVQDKHPWSWPP